ncbi:endospore germination permease [Paenibacillus sp. FSL R10-2734]|uniref:GerAB/ArcD/ProY family transporter n=1 Tax=Paenibacillus sp. FSL R10-2734 TaxID=2954691 RepID=UPI0030DA91A5
MEKAKISPRQLLILVFMFEIVSAIISGFGAEAKQDAWITAIIGMLGGICLFLLYHRLSLFYPDLPLTEYAKKILGPVVGRVVALLYVVYFLFNGSFVIRDFASMAVSFVFAQTPFLVIIALMLVTVMYVIGKGIEVLSRTAELFFAVLFLVSTTGLTLILTSGNVDLQNLRPVLEEGWFTILKQSIPGTVVFPFGEVIVFLMLFPYVDKPQQVKKTVITGLLISGCFIAFIMMINVSVLGADLFTRTQYPLLTTSQLIEGKAFLERLDALFLVTAIVGGFFRIGLFLYATLIGAATLFGIPSYRKLIIPVGMVMFICSLAMASNNVEFNYTGSRIVRYYVQIPILVIFPLILLLVGWIQEKKKSAS